MNRTLKQFLKAVVSYNPVPLGKVRSEELVPILRYHSFDSTGSGHSTTHEQWRLHVGFLRDRGLKVVSLWDYFALPYSDRDRAIMMTFDDGYENNYDYAFRDLTELGYTATFFVAPNYVGKTASWIDRDLEQLLDAGYEHLDEPFEAFATRARLNTKYIQEHLPLLQQLKRRTCLRELYNLYKVRKLRLMGWNQIREMSRAGMDIGAHTLSHGSFGLLDEKQTKDEIQRSKTAIEEQIQSEVKYFCYPYGNLPKHVPAIVRESGFRGACSCERGYWKRGDDVFWLKRIDMERISSRLDLKFLLNEHQRWLVARWWSRNVRPGYRGRA